MTVMRRSFGACRDEASVHSYCKLLFFMYERNVQKKLVKRETGTKGSGTFSLVPKTDYSCNCVCTLTIFCP